jgi:DNA-binding FrmR family transcriptional regulator
MALKRGLTGVLASMIRLSDSEWNANDGAARMVRNDPRVREIVETIAVRAAERAADQAVERLVREELDHRLDQWQAEQDVPQRSLVYSKGLGAGAEFSLLKQPDVVSWSDWTVPMSMRDVEPPVSLVLRERGIVPVTDEWDMPTKHPEAEDEPDGEENP